MINADLFTPVLAWLDARAPHTPANQGFNMTYYAAGGDDHKGHPCGTAMCIAGATVMFNPQLEISVDNFTSSLFDVAPHLGLDHKQARELFLAAEFLENDPEERSLREITPDHAARTIRHLIKTGIVDWSANA